jgi:hypothetical protein
MKYGRPRPSALALLLVCIFAFVPHFAAPVQAIDATGTTAFVVNQDDKDCIPINVLTGMVGKPIRLKVLCCTISVSLDQTLQERGLKRRLHQ